MSSNSNVTDGKTTKKTKTKTKKRNWKEYNESLVRRGEIMFNTDFLSNWPTELRNMNNGKKGAKYLYPNSFIFLLATIHIYLLPYRQMEGFLKIMSENIPRLKNEIPDYTTMWWRIVRTKVELNPKINPNENVTIAVDSTGIKVSNRGEWIRNKWNQNRKGFIKIHVAVNIKTKQIVSMEVTKEDVGDGKMLKPLIQQQQQQQQRQQQNITRVIADGAYDSKDNFSYLARIRIKPIIKVRKNSSAKNNNNCLSRKQAIVEQQLNDIKIWKKKYRYGMRWIVESAFSSIKRIFGEYVKSMKWNNIVNELFLKASIYNTFMNMTAQ